MTSATLIAQPRPPRAERRRDEERRADRPRGAPARRRMPGSRPRGALGGSPPGAGGRLLQL